MRFQKTTYKDHDGTPRVRFDRTLDDAASARKQLRKEGAGSIESLNTEVPTTSHELCAYLNELVTNGHR